MNNRRLVMLSVLVFGIFSASGQDINEAYNFSGTGIQGTARSIGFGNALGSIGGDFSSLSINPAGLGVYRSSELAITPSLDMNNASSKYLNATTADNAVLMSFNHVGLVLTNAPKGERYERRNWKTVSFAIGMNKLADFNRSYTYTGKNTTSSASQEFEADANKYPNDTSMGNAGSLAFLGYQGYLLNINSNNKFYSIVPFSGGINQTNSVQESGAINEFVLSLGGNYKEKLMLGITLGIPSINYNMQSQYSETVAAGNTAANPSNFSSFSYNQNLNITGGGINAKIGAIYKLTDFLRIGAAFHTPTYYSIDEVSDPELNSSVNGSSYNLSVGNGLAENHFSYTLTTPWKGVLSASVILKKLGFITTDCEYVDYSTMKYQFPIGFDNATGNTFQQEATALNAKISNSYQAVTNFRLGAEIKIAPYFMVRGGVGYYGNPYKKVDNVDNNAQRVDLSLGVGFHFRHFFTDFGVINSTYTHTEQPYSTIDYSNVVSGSPAAVPLAKVNYSLNNVALTVGFKF